MACEGGIESARLVYSVQTLLAGVVVLHILKPGDGDHGSVTLRGCHARRDANTREEQRVVGHWLHDFHLARECSRQPRRFSVAAVGNGSHRRTIEEGSLRLRPHLYIYSRFYERNGSNLHSLLATKRTHTYRHTLACDKFHVLLLSACSPSKARRLSSS